MLFLRNNDLAAKMTIRPDKTIFQIATAGYTAEKIVYFLYANADVELDRKAVIAAKVGAALKAVAAGLADTEVEVLPFAEAVAAHGRMESRALNGRIVLSPQLG